MNGQNPKTSLDELFRRSEVFVLYFPLLPTTKRVINKGNNKKMKDHVMIINDSRGPLINEKTLQSGKVAGAAVDVSR